MRKYLTVLGLAGLIIMACGTKEIASNEYFGLLPGIALNWKEETNALSEELDNCTDMDKSFTLQREIELLEQDTDDEVAEYWASNPSLPDIPFELATDYQFVIENIRVYQPWSDHHGICFIANVTITEDIMNQWGNPSGTIFAYIKGVDAGSNLLNSYHSYGKLRCTEGPFVTGMEIEMIGSLNYPGALLDFDKLILVSEEEYDAKY